MAPGFVNSLFTSSRNEDQSLSLSASTTSPASSISPHSSTNTTTRTTLTSFRNKFRASVVTPSTLSSSTKSITNTALQDASSPDNYSSGETKAVHEQKSSSLSVSMPASTSSSSSFSHRSSTTRSGTPLWEAVSSKLSKRSNTKNNSVSSSSPALVSSSSPSLPFEAANERNRTNLGQDRSVTAKIEDEDSNSNKGTITRSSLRRTLSRLSLNTPTLNARQPRERMFTSSSYKSILSPSPRLGCSTIVNDSTSSGRDSPRIPPYFRLPRLQNFSPHLRLDTTGNGDNDAGVIDSEEENNSTVRDSKKGTVGRNTKPPVSTYAIPKASSIPSTLTLTSSPMTRFGFTSHSSQSSGNSQYYQHSQNDVNVIEDLRYKELANLISILEQSPRSPRASAPSTPSLSLKKSSFSLKRSTRVKNTPNTLHNSSSQRPSIGSPDLTTKNQDLLEGTADCRMTRGKSESLLKAHRLLETRSYSFPAPSIPPPLPEKARLKPSKSLTDLLFLQPNSSRSTSSRRVSIVSSASNTGKTFISYSEESMIESCYPAFCTPPRTPRSRHASIEWFVDFIAVDEDEKNCGLEVQEIACDESTLMPDILGPPIQLVHEKKQNQKYKEGLVVNGPKEEEEEHHNRSSEVYDSLMKLIDSFPSPTFGSTSKFSPTNSATTPSSPSSCAEVSPSGASSPNTSLWSTEHAKTASITSSSPISSTALVTPVSGIPKDVIISESGYLSGREDDVRPVVDEEERVGNQEGYTIEDEENRRNLKEDGSRRKFNGSVLASHKALADVLALSL